MSVDYKLIGTRIKSKRKEKSITQESLAERLFVSVGYISQVERGYSKPNLEFLSSLCQILDCDISELVSNVTIEKDDFLNDELNKIFTSMNSNQKNILFEIAKIIVQNGAV